MHNRLIYISNNDELNVSVFLKTNLCLNNTWLNIIFLACHEWNIGSWKRLPDMRLEGQLKSWRVGKPERMRRKEQQSHMLWEQYLFQSSFLSLLSAFLYLCSSFSWYYSTVKFLAPQSRKEFLSTLSLSWALGNPPVWDLWRQQGHSSCCHGFAFLAIVKSSPAWACDEDESEFPFHASTRGSPEPALTWQGLGGEISPRRSQYLLSILGKNLFLNSTRRLGGWSWGGKGVCIIRGPKQEYFFAFLPFTLSKSIETVPWTPIQSWAVEGGALPEKEGGSNCHSGQLQLLWVVLVLSPQQLVTHIAGHMKLTIMTCASLALQTQTQKSG